MERLAVSPGKMVLGMKPTGPGAYLHEIKICLHGCFTGTLASSHSSHRLIGNLNMTLSENAIVKDCLVPCVTCSEGSLNRLLTCFLHQSLI